MEDPRPLEVTGNEVDEAIGEIIDNTARLVNNIRRQARGNIHRAEELEDMAEEFRHIAELQMELAHRVAQLGVEALSNDFLGQDEEDDEEDPDDEDFEDEETD